MTNNIKWPLASSSFTIWDKINIATWLLTGDRYTMGTKTEELEAKFSEFSNTYALMFSSGSSANQMVFELWKVKNPDKKALVIVPATTWVSSITPALMAGMDIEFCDINLNDFSFDYEMLEKILEKNKDRNQIIWPTALIGFSPDMERLHGLADKYKADLYLDACENTFSENILSSCDVVTTSTYLSHQVTSVEGGFCFFKNEEDWKIAKMFRNHGMSRSLSPSDPVRILIESNNPEIDPRFLFALGGTNMRPSDVHAMFGLQDFKRIDKSKKHREDLYETFVSELDPYDYFVAAHPNHSAFCFPIFRKDNKLKEVKEILSSHGIETRPIIGSNLLYQPPFKKYGNPKDFPNAEWIHNHGCYCGLHGQVTEQMVEELVQILNNL